MGGKGEGKGVPKAHFRGTRAGKRAREWGTADYPRGPPPVKSAHEPKVVPPPPKLAQWDPYVDHLAPQAGPLPPPPKPAKGLSPEDSVEQPFHKEVL